MKNEKIPIKILTGYLGSGKTTLLSEALKHPDMTNTAVLVNEFGKLGIDHHLLRQVDEETILLGGGCVCCNKRKDLENALKELLDKYERGKIQQLDSVVIETTGLADPSPIIFTILTNPILQNHYYVDCVVVTVDAVNGNLHLKQFEAIKQITAADKVIITKADLTSEKSIDELIERIQNINPSTKFQISKKDEGNSRIIRSHYHSRSVQSHHKRKWQDSCSNKHLSVESEIKSISFSFHRPLDWIAFGIWLSMLLYARGEEILRVKGLLNIGEEGPTLLNGVQHVVHPPEHLAQWPAGQKKDSHLVLIIKSIQPDEILYSLRIFQDFLGSEPKMTELDVQI